MDTTGRDRGLTRISRLTRWSVAGALGLTGVFSVMVARARPGAARSTSSGPAAPADTSTPTTTPSVDDNNSSSVLQPPLQPPAQAPRRGRGGGSVTSGSS